MTPRPGRIGMVLEVPLPRPRKVADLGTAKFAELTAVLRAALHPEGEAAEAPQFQLSD